MGKNSQEMSAFMKRYMRDEEFKKSWKERSRSRRAKVVTQMLLAYGNRCADCGCRDTTRLTIRDCLGNPFRNPWAMEKILKAGCPPEAAMPMCLWNRHHPACQCPAKSREVATN